MLKNALKNILNEVENEIKKVEEECVSELTVCTYINLQNVKHNINKMIEEGDKENGK